jgi:hypothetical protein
MGLRTSCGRAANGRLCPPRTEIVDRLCFLKIAVRRLHCLAKPIGGDVIAIIALAPGDVGTIKAHNKRSGSVCRLLVPGKGSSLFPAAISRVLID